MTWYLTWPHYPDSEPTTPCRILIMLSTLLGSDNYQILCHWFDSPSSNSCSTHLVIPSGSIGSKCDRSTSFHILKERRLAIDGHAHLAYMQNRFHPIRPHAQKWLWVGLLVLGCVCSLLKAGGFLFYFRLANDFTKPDRGYTSRGTSKRIFLIGSRTS